MSQQINTQTIDFPLSKPLVILLLGPHRNAVSGVSTHLNMLMNSDLAKEFRLKHFQVGSEGRTENTIGRITRLLISPFALVATILSKRVDIVHINTSLNIGAYWRDLVYMILARLSGARILYQVHGGDLPEQFAKHSQLLKFLLRSSLRLPEMIVVLARRECEVYQRFIRSTNVRLLPNAIDWAPYVNLVRQPKLDPQPLRLIYIGRISRQKGLFDALNGLDLARRAGAQVHFLIAGSGPDEEELRRTVLKLDLSEAVSFVNPVFGKDKIRLMCEADVLLFPSYTEGLPYALLECMAAGLPAITTRVGAIPDVLIENRHGLFVMPRDAEAIAQAINQFVGNPLLVAQMGAACRQRIESTYSMQRMVSQFSQLYSEIGAY